VTLYEGASLRNDVGGAEILQRCIVRSWEPTHEDDETCRVCGHRHIQLCYEIYDPETGLVVFPVGSECIFTYTQNTPQDRAVAHKAARYSADALAAEQDWMCYFESHPHCCNEQDARSRVDRMHYIPGSRKEAYKRIGVYVLGRILAARGE